jgi:hypothetical protein
MEIINTRSPHFIRSLAITKDYVKCEIFIYQGESVIDRNTVTYTLSQRTPTDGYYVFEVSELIRDYLDVQFNGNYNSNMIWVDYRFTTGTDSGGDDTPSSYTVTEAYEGYGYFKEGAQSTLLQINEGKLLQSNTLIIKPQNRSIRIPIRQDSTYDVDLSYKSELISTYGAVNEIDDGDRIAYLHDYIGFQDDTYKERVINSFGTFEGSNCLDNLLGLYDFTPIDRVLIDNDVEVTVQSVKECKYNPIKATFVNKFGVLQDIWFFGRASRDIQTKSTDYLSNIITTGAWDASTHQKKTTENNGQESIALNSGYYPEEYNEVFKQLFLSEKVWLEIDGMTRPVNLSSKSMAFKTQLSDKLIEYAVKFTFSNDIINNIR